LGSPAFSREIISGRRDPAYHKAKPKKGSIQTSPRVSVLKEVPSFH
jgi:hypothetical protein